MRTNIKRQRPHGETHEGAPASAMNPEQALRRSVMSCLLWENEFYEDGTEISKRIGELATQVSHSTLAALAIETRERANLRHVPLLLLSYLAKKGGGQPTADTITRVIQRADELTEFLAIHAKVNGVTPDKIKSKISNPMRKGIAGAFCKFDEYQLAKYDRAGAIRLRDALFLCHATPKDDVQAALWKRLVENKLEIPDTWETNLSGGKDKKETFERLLKEGKLGYLALLRNLRNMTQAGCDEQLVEGAILARKGSHRVLPFRYVAAARAAPQFEPAIDSALKAAVGELTPLPGRTVVLVDVSGSMDEKLSSRSDLTRVDAAAALASIINGDLRVFTFSDLVIAVPARRGMAGVDVILKSQPHRGTHLGAAVQRVNETLNVNRLIVITDEQSHDRVPEPKAEHAYMINVASNKRGVGYGRWVHIDGFSENVLRFIHEYESRR